MSKNHKSIIKMANRFQIKLLFLREQLYFTVKNNHFLGGKDIRIIGGNGEKQNEKFQRCCIRKDTLC